MEKVTALTENVNVFTHFLEKTAVLMFAQIFALGMVSAKQQAAPATTTILVLIVVFPCALTIISAMVMVFAVVPENVTAKTDLVVMTVISPVALKIVVDMAFVVLANCATVLLAGPVSHATCKYVAKGVCMEPALVIILVCASLAGEGKAANCVFAMSSVVSMENVTRLENVDATLAGRVRFVQPLCAV
jgi:hypothetical protein